MSKLDECPEQISLAEGRFCSVRKYSLIPIFPQQAHVCKLLLYHTGKMITSFVVDLALAGAVVAVFEIGLKGSGNSASSSSDPSSDPSF